MGEHDATADSLPEGFPERLGPCRLLRKLGAGGMGSVFLAEMVEERPYAANGARVAVKVLHPERLGASGIYERFLREVSLGRALEHPAVVHTWDADSVALHLTTYHFLIMEYVEGPTLQELIRQHGNLAEARLRELATEAASGLEAIHAAGAVHRDLKPTNLLVTPGGRVKLMDLGIARLLDDSEHLTSTDQFVGTLLYAAPEQFSGASVGPAADLYSLGVILYEAATGLRPFAAQSAPAIMKRHLGHTPPLLRHVDPQLSPFFEELVACLLEKDPARRMGSASVLRASLESGEVSSLRKAEQRSHEESLQETRDQESVSLAVGPQPREVQHSLPAERDAFLGRGDELLELSRRLHQGARQVTVLGPGGTGKTRLVRRYGWNWLAEWPGGVWFCDLSEARSLEGIASAVAGPLAVPLGKEDPVVKLGHAIAGRGRCLIILDNFEQVAEHAEATLGRWLDRASEAAFVVTSRERLRLEGEEVMSLEPLPVDGAAVDLFVVRARAQRQDFSPTDENVQAIREAVRLLDGLPLAIELAAARISVLSPAQLLARLEDRFKLLAGVRGAKARHATLRAAIDWSWGMLEPWEQAAIGQCSVFEGGFTLEAAEAVLDLSAWPEAPCVMDAVQSVLDKSLLRSWTPAVYLRYAIEEPYFGMYVSIQEYAREKLRTEGALADGASGAGAERAAFGRHGRHYAGMGTEEALDSLLRHGGVARLKALEQDLDNLMLASRRALARADGSTASAAYRAAWEVLRLRGPYTEGMALGREVLAMDALEPQERGLALWTLGMAEENSGRVDEARRHLEEALSVCRQLGERRMEAMVLGSLGGLDSLQGRPDAALDYFAAALAIHRDLGNRGLEGIVLGNRGGVYHMQGRLDDARQSFEAALEIHRGLGNRRHEGITLGNLGSLHYVQGRLDAAKECCQTALEVHREVGSRSLEGAVLCNLGNVHWQQGQLVAAEECYQTALEIERQVGSRHYQGIVLGNLGILQAQQGRLDEARELYEAALAFHREVGDRGSEAAALSNLASMHRDQGRLDEAQAVLTEGVALLRETGDKRMLGLLLVERGQCELQAGDTTAARAALDEAAALAEASEAEDDSELGRSIAELRAALSDGGPDFSGR